MIKWISQISIKKVLLAGFVITVFSLLVRQIEAVFTMKYYLMPEYFGLWSKLMMPKAGPPPAQFFITSLVFTFVTSVALCIIYYYLKDHLPENPKKRIFYFADLMVGTSFIFFTLPVYLMFNVPINLLAYWFVSTFIIILFASVILVKIIKP